MVTEQPPQAGFTRIVARTITLFIFAVATAFPTQVPAIDLFLGTDAAGSFSHFTGRAICRTINRHATGLECQAVPAPDGIHNLTNLQGGSLDMALVESNTLHDAINKKGWFEFLDIRYDSLGGLVPVYQQAILLVTRTDAGIENLNGLKGKRINAGVPLTRTHQAVELILTAKGWTDQDFKVVEALSASLSQDAMAFCHGSIQAMVHIGVHPDSGLQKLITLCKAVPVDMDDTDIAKLVDGSPAYSRMIIPAGTYPDLTRPASTFGTTVSLLASGGLDDETVQTILAVLDEHRQAIQSIHPVLGAFDPNEQAAQDMGISLHPGAAAFLSRGNN